MSHTNTWDETTPTDNSKLGVIDDNIRSLKLDFKERFTLDHYMDGELDTDVAGADGHHRKVTLPEQSSDPTAVTDAIILFSKDVDGVTGLYAKHGS